MESFVKSWAELAVKRSYFLTFLVDQGPAVSVLENDSYAFAEDT
jgi:hypothetical protein